MSGDNETSAETLSQLFDRGFALYNRLEESEEDSSSKAFQDRVRKAILIMEDATRLVSALDLFSSNEEVSEVPTEHLKYFLLPALLGSLHGKLRDEGAERAEVIRVQEAYFRDFLRRCNDYEICEVKVPEDDDVEESEEKASRPGPPDLAKMNAEREAKLKRYKEKKELEERLKQLKDMMDAGRIDDDEAKEYHIGTIRRFVGICLDELSSFATEKPILKHMKAVRAGKVAPGPKKAPPPRPMKPIIITRDAAQKEVFGLGYKNVPVMSIEEFYDQRVREGWFPAPNTGVAGGGGSLQDRAGATEEEARMKEEEEREEERKEEQDDEEERRKKMGMDEYRDTHRRGWGNRHNMG